MARAIDAENTMNKLLYGDAYISEELAEYIKQVFDEQPTIEAETVKHGKWMQRDSADYECTECGFRFTSADPISMFEFCRCGARMDGE